MKLDKGDQIILTGLSLLILLANINGGGTTATFLPIDTPVPVIDTPVPTLVPTVIPEPTPDVLFDIDRDTNALLYQKENCTILIKNFSEIGSKNAEIGNCTFEDWEDFKSRMPQSPTPKPTVEPTAAVKPTASTHQLTINELKNIFEDMSSRGWNNLYEINEFDCSRMSSYWQITLEKEYGIRSYIVESRIRTHAWIQVRVSDFSGEKDSSSTWTDNDGVEWYYIESTVPRVAGYYDVPFYDVNDRKLVGTYDEAVSYNRKEFELTSGDIQKVTNFMNQ